MDFSPTLVEGLLLMATAGLTGWLWKMQTEISDIKLDLAKNYHAKAEIKEMLTEALGPINETMKEVKDELRELRKRNDSH